MLHSRAIQVASLRIASIVGKNYMSQTLKHQDLQTVRTCQNAHSDLDRDSGAHHEYT